MACSMSSPTAAWCAPRASLARPAVAPSTLTIIGRISSSRKSSGISRIEARSGNEIQLTDGLDRLIADGQPFHGLRAAARRFDCGDKLGYLEANVALGLQHPVLGAAFRRILQNYL